MSIKKLIVLVLFGWLLAAPAAAFSASPEGSFLVQTAPVADQEIPATIMAYGRVQPDPDLTKSVSVPRQGLVTKVLVRLGQEVKTGDPLFEFETAPDAMARYEQAKAAVTFAEKNLAHVKNLYSEQLATRNELAAAQKTLADAKAALNQQTGLGANVGVETLRAPFAGIVTKLAVSPGDRLQADTTTVVLASQDTLIVQLGVEAEDMDLLQPGGAVVITSPWDKNFHVDSTITAIHRMINPKTGLIDVIVKLNSSENQFLVIGVPVKGEFIIPRPPGLLIPKPAVLYDDSGPYVFVAANGKAERRAVTTGVEWHGFVAVTGNLKAGETVIVAGVAGLYDGAAIREGEK